jgi:hypothetical protein
MQNRCHSSTCLSVSRLQAPTSRFARCYQPVFTARNHVAIALGGERVDEVVVARQRLEAETACLLQRVACSTRTDARTNSAFQTWHETLVLCRNLVRKHDEHSIESCCRAHKPVCKGRPRMFSSALKMPELPKKRRLSCFARAAQGNRKWCTILD